jgi:hypothetical protein
LGWFGSDGFLELRLFFFGGFEIGFGRERGKEEGLDLMMLLWDTVGERDEKEENRVDGRAM